MPIEHLIEQVTIVEPALELRKPRLKVRVEYKDPNPDGVLPTPSESVDLVLCLSVLHHVANVSFVLHEIARVLSTGGFAIVREPTISMGDWRGPRRGLTAHERGIPLQMLRDMIENAGLDVVKETRCMFSLTPRLTRVAGIAHPYNSPRVVALDELAARLFSWNQTYHATRLYQRFRPTDVSFVLAKRDDPSNRPAFASRGRRKASSAAENEEARLSRSASSSDFVARFG